MQPTLHVNKDLLQQRLAIKHLSQRSLAKILDRDPSAISLMFKGKRRPQLHEAIKMAEILGLSLDAVLEMFGLNPPKEGKSVVALAGLVDENGLVHPIPKSGPRYANRPAGVPDNTLALRMSENGPFRDWLIYYVPTNQIEPGAVNRWAVVQVLGEKGLRVGMLIGGTKDKWKLSSLYILENSREYRLQWAAPIIVAIAP